MNNLFSLYKAELYRLNKYMVLKISGGLAVLWAILLWLAETPQEAAILYPQLVFLDVALLSVLMVSSSIFLEKTEGTLKSLLVAPVKIKDVILSKILSAITLSLLSFTIITGAFIAITWGNLPLLGVEPYIFGYLALFIMIISAFNGFLGLTITIFSKEFTSVLMWYMGYAIISIFPPLILTLVGTTLKVEYILLILPGQSINNLIGVFSTTTIDYLLIGLSILNLLLLSVILYKTIISKKFLEDAMKG